MIRVLVFAIIFAACGTGPTPVPTPPPSDARFSGFHDCTDDPTDFYREALVLAAACGDHEDTAACFTAVADQGGDTTQLLCAARDVEVAAYVEIDRGTATPELTARAKRLRAWLGQTGAIPRGQP